MPPKRTYSELSLLIATVSILVTVTIAMPSEFEDHQQENEKETPTLMRAATFSSSMPSADQSSWSKLQISPDTIGSVKYGALRINVYAHARNQHQQTTQPTATSNRYFYAPLCLLNHKTATSSVNVNANPSQKYQVSFDVEMWNDDLQKEVTNWIKEKDKNVNEDLVQITPFEQVTLGFSCATCFSDRFSLSTAWMPYTMTKSVTMRLFCYSQSDCDSLAQEMRERPQMFSDLRLLLSVASQTSKTKETQISVESIRSSNMAAKLNQQMGTKDSAFLTADDEQRFFSESANNIIVDSFDDSDSDSIFSEGSKDKILNFLKVNLLEPSRTIIKEVGDKNWESVYWNPDNYRPDVTTKALNDVYSKSDKETQQKLIDEWTNTNKFGAEYGVGIEGIAEVKTKLDTDFSRSGKNTKEDLQKFMQESKNNVQWDGSKFVPKPMTLSRLNLAKLRDTQTFKDRSVKVSYRTAVLTVGIHTTQEAKLQSIDTVTELHLQLKRSNADLQSQLDNVISKFNSVLPTLSAASDVNVLKDTVAKLTSKVNEPKKTMAYFNAQIQVFTNEKSTVPYNIEQTNIGGGFDSSSGVFKAPSAGVYMFTVSGIASTLYTKIYLVLNGSKSSSSHAEIKYGTFAMQQLLNLNAGDRVSVFLERGGVGATDDIYNHFTGIQLQ